MEGDMTDGSPPTAPDRIAAIRAAMTDDAEAGATFAEPVRGSVGAALERLDAIVGSAPHAEAAALLQHLRDRISGLDPARLEPRRGLSGLFDSRGKRLKAFRAAYLSAADAAASGAAELVDRGSAIARRSEDLNALWTELRAGVSDLDDHLDAGRAWLVQRNATASAPLPPEAAAAFEDAVEPAAPPEETSNEAETGPVEAQADAEANRETVAPAALSETTPPHDAEAKPDSAAAAPVEAQAEPSPPPSAGLAALPHPLEARLTALAALRARAVAALPRIRALQNADHAAPAALASARDDVEAWSAEWRDALGLSGRKPKKVRPDAARLVGSRDALIGRLSAAKRVLASAQARLAELTPRTQTPREEVRAAA
jgi:hypothetical protein